MADSSMKFMALKGKLFLKLSGGDSTYTKELSEMKKLLPLGTSFKNELGSALKALARLTDNSMMPDILKVAEETGCASKPFLLMERKLKDTSRQTADKQLEVLQELLREPFPEDASDDDKRGFFSEMLNMAININQADLITGVIHKIEELS